MDVYHFTCRDKAGVSARSSSAMFADDARALKHARTMLARCAIVEVNRGAAHLARLTAETNFGRRHRYAAPVGPPASAKRNWLSWIGAS